MREKGEKKKNVFSIFSKFEKEKKEKKFQMTWKMEKRISKLKIEEIRRERILRSNFVLFITFLLLCFQ